MNVCEMAKSQGSDLMLGETKHRYLRKERCLKKEQNVPLLGVRRLSVRLEWMGPQAGREALGTDKCGSLGIGKICFL